MLQRQMQARIAPPVISVARLVAAFRNCRHDSAMAGKSELCLASILVWAAFDCAAFAMASVAPAAAVVPTPLPCHITGHAAV